MMILDPDFAWTQYDDDADWSIWSWLKSEGEDWTRLIRDYWGIDETKCPEHLKFPTWESARVFSRVADRLLVSGRTLSLESSASAPSPVRLTQEQLRTLQTTLRSLRSNPIVRDLIGVALAREDLTRAAGAEMRFFRLVSLMRQSAVSDRAARYVDRVTSLYLFGFEPEVAVMARGALEAALRDRLGQAFVKSSLPPTLEEMMAHAGETGVLPQLIKDRSPRGWFPKARTALWHADRIRLAGNFALHDEPTYRPPDDGIHDAYNAIRELALVLRVLFP